MALGKIAFLPFAYSLDRLRWDIFSGKVKSEDFDKAYWDLRYDLQGVAPIVKRRGGFDAGAKYHVPGDVPYIR